MVEFLTTQGTSYHLENIIINANNWLILISPYLNITENFLQRLQDADRRKVKICIVYGKDKLKTEEKVKLQKIKNLSLRYCKNLHAKCYLNENSMIITSMNMYEFSEKTNREMGILINKENEADITTYEKGMNEVKSILDSAKSGIESNKGASIEVGEVIESISYTISEKETNFSQIGNGYCIRCRREIPLDPDKPYCYDCYDSWSDWGNPSYIEEYCHSCGRSDDSSMLYPLCRSCFKKLMGY